MVQSGKTKVGMDTLELPLVSCIIVLDELTRILGGIKVGKTPCPTQKTKLIRNSPTRPWGSGTGGGKEDLRCSGLWGKVLPRDYPHFRVFTLSPLGQEILREIRFERDLDSFESV